MGSNKREDYVYLPLKDAIASIGQKVNLYCVVIDFGTPTMSKGSDYFCTLKLIDKSHQEPPVPVTMFAQSPEMLPRVESSGDIIRLHRVMMRIRNQEVFAVYNKKMSSFLLVAGIPSEDLKPYQVSSANAKVTEVDKVLVGSLREWLFNHPIASGATIQPQQLQHIVEDQPFDLVCKVVHIFDASKEGPVAYVWDGTDAPPTSFDMEQDSESLPLKLTQHPVGRDILCTFPSAGTVMKVAALASSRNLDTLLQNLGRWVRIHKIICKPKFGLWEGILAQSSRIVCLSGEDTFVHCRERYYDERLSSAIERMSFWSFPHPSDITETRLDHLQFSTLREVLTHAEVTSQYKCIVRVIETFPSLAENFLSPSRVYRIRLTLEDSTARIHAYVYGEDGAEFFGGYPSVDELKVEMEKLLGIHDFSKLRNPPWVQCGIKSYYLDKSRPWETRRYRIDRTKLVGCK